MYFARDSKGHAGVKGTPAETYGGILAMAMRRVFTVMIPAIRSAWYT